jgi:hypothetical protein
MAEQLVEELVEVGVRRPGHRLRVGVCMMLG